MEPINNAPPAHAYPDSPYDNDSHSATPNDPTTSSSASTHEEIEAASPDESETQNSSDGVSTNTKLHGIPAKRMPSGMLLSPGNKKCGRMQVYIPGHAQELGLRGVVSSKSKQDEWISYLVGGKNYNLGHKIKENSCPILILNDSSTSPSSAELKEAMKNAGANELEVVSHSGGYVGLKKMMNQWSASDIQKISSLKMLDNFYDEDIAGLLSRKIGQPKLSEICRGFSTSWRVSRVASACPKIKVSKDANISADSPIASMVVDQKFDHKKSVSWFL